MYSLFMKSEFRDYLKNEYKPLNFLQGSKFETLCFDPQILKVAKKLVSENFSRSLLCATFLSNFSSSCGKKKLTVAVVGGYRNEPEIRILKHFGYELMVETFGIEGQDFFLDLNDDPSPATSKNFDLVLCSQVLEHVYDHHKSFKSLTALLKMDGFLWISCPASNIPHALNSYYSAGFTAEYLASNLRRFKLQVVNFGQIGSLRLYRTIHTLRTWPTVRGYYNPIFFGDNSRPRSRQIFFLLRYFLRNLETLFFSKKVTSDIRVATDSWILARKSLN